jgi:hypothetical protein
MRGCGVSSISSQTIAQVVIFENVTVALRAMSSKEKPWSLPGGELSMRSILAAHSAIFALLASSLSIAGGSVVERA